MLKQRVFAALVLIPAFLAALFLLPAFYWSVLAIVLGGVAAWEWAHMSQLRGMLAYAYVALIGLLTVLGIFMALPEMLVHGVAILILGFWLGIAPVWMVRSWSVRDSRWLALAGMMVLVPTAWAFVGLRETDPMLVLLLMGLVWLADSAAFFSGKRWGRHKLAPRISPGKTWEGVWGALLAVMIYLLAWRGLGLEAGQLTQFSQGVWLAWGIFLVCISILGDLFESHLKRCAGVKDSGNLIPGHGGLLDRIDSQTSVLPIAWALILLTKPIHA